MWNHCGSTKWPWAEVWGRQTLSQGHGTDREDYGGGGATKTGNGERERDKAGERRENGKDLFQETVTILHYEWGEIYLSPAVRSGRRAGRGASLNATSEVYLCKLLPQEGVEWQLDVTLSLAYPGSSPGPAQWVQYSLCHRDCVTRHGWPFAFSRYLVATVNYNFPFAASPAVSLLAAAFQISLMGCEISFISAHNRASEQFWTI